MPKYGFEPISTTFNESNVPTVLIGFVPNEATSWDYGLPGAGEVQVTCGPDVWSFVFVKDGQPVKSPADFTELDFHELKGIYAEATD